MDGISPFEPCQPSDARCSGSWLHTVNWIESGNQKVSETCVVLWHDNRIFPRCNKFFVFCKSETETCWESCIIHFPTTLPCSTRVGVLETGDVPFLFSLSQTKHVGITIELDPKGDKSTCPAFGLYSSPPGYSTMGHIVLDLTSLAYQPKSRARSVRPKKHVTFALSEQKTAYPAHTRELDEDEDDKPLVQLASREEPVKRESAAERRVPTPLRNRKEPPVWRDPSATLEQDVSGNSRER